MNERGGSTPEEFNNPEVSRTPEEISRLVSEARNHAQPDEVLDEIQNQQDNLLKELMAGGIDYETFRREMETLSSSDDGVLLLDDIHEFALALENTSLNNQAKEWILGHEYSHYLAAASNGLESRFFLRFAKDSDGRITVTPGVRVVWPEGIDREEQRRIMTIITGAPEDLSESDLRRMGPDSE